MKSHKITKHFVFSLSICAVAALPLTGFSKEKEPAKTVTAVTSAPSVSGSKFGLGVASAGNFTGGTSSLTALLRLSSEDAIQFHFTLPSTSPFQITAGGIFKHDVAESQNAAFHVGGGLALGALSGGAGGSGFALAVGPIAGVNFHFSDIPRVHLHVDGGAMFSTVDGSTSFAVGALSGVLGLSVLYML